MQGRYLGWSHPLAEVAARHCRVHVPVGPRIGWVACGACWERAIRDDERVVVEYGLPRELVPDPEYVDEVAVRLACRGERVRLTAAERAEAIRVLFARGLSRGQVAARLRMVYRDVPDPDADPRQPDPTPPAGGSVVAFPIPVPATVPVLTGKAA